MTARAGARAGAFGIADQVLLSLGNLAVGLALARELPASAFGVYVVAFAVLLMGLSVQVALVTDPLVIFGSTRSGTAQSRYFASLIRVQALIAAGLAALLGAVGFGWWAAGGGGSEFPPALFGVAIAIVPLQIQWFFRAVFFARLRPAAVFWNDLLCIGLRLVALGGLIAAGRLSAFSAFLAAGLGALVASAVAAPLCRDLFVSGFEPLRGIWGEHWRYGRWLLATSGAYWCSGQAPALLASSLLSPVAAAVIKACQFMVAPLNVTLNGLDGVLAPRAARVHAGEGPAGLARFCRVFAGLAAAGALVYCAALLPLAPAIMDVVFKGRYSGRTAIVAVLMLDAVLSAAARAPVLRLKVLGETRRVFAAYAVSAAAGLTCLLVLAPLYGILGAAMSAPAASGVLLFVLLASARRAPAGIVAPVARAAAVPES
ncbi:MAG TPA: hypothetical protein VFP98_08960 [Candidatus Polarisedimenticolia bacterium]|nr:hypothetical protein [Candidatus Polarisedimenticolia bacterium]